MTIWILLFFGWYKQTPLPILLLLQTPVLSLPVYRLKSHSGWVGQGQAGLKQG